MRSIRAKFTLLTVCAIIAALCIATAISVFSIKSLGESDADQLLHLMCTNGSMNLESYFNSVESSVETVSVLVQGSLEETPLDQLGDQVERARNLFGTVAQNTNGVLTYYFRIDPEISKTVKGFWYVNMDGKGFTEYEVTDITQYDTNDTSSLVWFTVPKATGKGIWLPPYFTDNLDVRVISYNAPVYWKDKFVGVIGIEIDYETLAREAESIKLFDNGYAFILDEDSNVIYHPQMDRTLQYGEQIAVGSPDSTIYPNHVHYRFNGVEKEAVWQLLSNGMRLYVTVPLSEANGRWRNHIWIILAAALVIVVIVSVVMMQFASRLIKPLRELTEAAKQVDRGDYEFTLNYNRNDEVGILTRTFKQLVAHTKDHISSLNKQVYVDFLTSVRNKGAYDDYIMKLQERINDPNERLEFAVGVFDCDNLKAINDNFGHDKGDIYLKTASRLICGIFRHSPVFRIGGDEFAVVLTDEDYINRDELLSRFYDEQKTVCASAENIWDQISVSTGFAVFDPNTDKSLLDLIHRADQLMYENKRLRKETQQNDNGASL